MILRKTPMAALVAFICSGLAQADSSTQMDPVVVTASRQAQRATDLLSDVTVISREEIERQGNNSLTDLLTRQAGIETSSNGGAGQNSSVYIRGANGNQTLVLIDGMRVNSASLGETALSRIPLSQIDRIEIVRGPASALYGADAIGGVIQLFTKRGEGPAQVNFFAGAGTQDTYETSAGISGAVDKLSYAAQVGTSSTRGFSSIANRDSSAYSPDKDGYQNQNFSGKLAWQFLDGHEVGANVFYSNGENKFDARYTYPFVSPASFNYRQDAKVESGSIYLRDRLTSYWTSTIRLGQGIDTSTNRVSDSRADYYQTRQTQSSWQNDIRLPVGDLLFALEELKQRLASSNSFDRTNRTIQSALLGWRANIGAHRFQANIRNDDNSQFGNRTTVFGAYGYQLTSALRLNGSYGTAFKAPTFNDLYYGGPGGLPNPNLRPEFSENWEAAAIYETVGQRASVTYYHNRVKDLIDWAPNPTPSDPYNWSPMNVNKALLEGVTLAASTRFDHWDLSGSLDLQSPREVGTGHLLRRRARQHAAVTLAYQGNGWRAGGEVQAVGQRYNDLENTQLLEGFTRVNLFGNYQLDKHWSVEGRLNNIFNDKSMQAYADNYDGTYSQYRLPGFSAFIGLRYSPSK